MDFTKSASMERKLKRAINRSIREAYYDDIPLEIIAKRNGVSLEYAKSVINRDRYRYNTLMRKAGLNHLLIEGQKVSKKEKTTERQDD